MDISIKLQKYLEQGGSLVIPTRVDDSALSSNKRSDLKDRKDTAKETSVDMMVSIHQNSFPKESVKGAQVFYFTKSEESKKLAECIQARLTEVDSSNTRVAKNNSDYYLLKNLEKPAVIIECGFLSNTEERKNLMDDEYQKKIAWAIYLGINDYYML